MVDEINQSAELQSIFATDANPVQGNAATYAEPVRGATYAAAIYDEMQAAIPAPVPDYFGYARTTRPADSEASGQMVDSDFRGSAEDVRVSLETTKARLMAKLAEVNTVLSLINQDPSFLIKFSKVKAAMTIRG